jgi:3-oxoacyl-ACP reductase-like protein
MSIFSRIKDAIFGHEPARTAQENSTAAQPRPAQPRPATGTRPASPAASAIPASPVNANWQRPVEPVDVEQVLRELAAQNPQKLNWESSIVDLMKLLGIESSLQHRQELARELGYTGDMNDSAKMNIWLHKRVMQELEKNGGKVPASLVA